jgi:S1/P1 Nuclease
MDTNKRGPHPDPFASIGVHSRFKEFPGKTRLRGTHQVRFRMRRIILVFFAWFGFLRVALGWGSEGHEAVGALAERLISEETRAKVQQVLSQGGDSDLASVSTWADNVRDAGKGKGPLANDPEAAAFNQHFPHNASWHFVDLSLGTKSYADAQGFTSADDIVHAIARCIGVLESAQPEEMTHAQALRLLVHFVGDVHQPLHCGSGYYRLEDAKPPELIRDPKEAVGLPGDRGGNDLFYGPKDELHALWDVKLVQSICDSTDCDVLADYLANFVNPPPAVSPGDYHNWAETWAVESVQAASQAYDGIQFRLARQNQDPPSLQIFISLPPDYEARETKAAAHQLAKAAARLAQLLDRIRWAE